MSGFSNPIVGGGGALVYPSIHSPGFQAGVTGWTIRKDGTAEFNGVTIRGQLTAGSITAGSIGSSTITASDFNNGTIESTVFTMDATGGLILIYASTKVVQTFLASGTLTVPGGVTAGRIQVWSGGNTGGPGIGSVTGGAAGNGGEYAEEPNCPLNTNNTVTIGAANNPTSVQGNGVLVKAFPGSGSVNTIHFPGGTGAAANGKAGGGGGSSAGPAGAGNNGSLSTGATGPAGSGKGGNGGAIGVNGSAGTVPGGGGGGGGASGGSAGLGAAGKAVATYQTGVTLIGALAPVAGTDAAGNAYGTGYTGDVTAFQPQAVPAVVETWHQVSGASSLGCVFLNNWGNSGLGATLAFRKCGGLANEVEISGDLVCTNVAGFVNNIPIATLPAGYTPLSTQQLDCIIITGTPTTPGIGRVSIPVSGNLDVEGLAGLAAGSRVFIKGRISTDR
jgi:hypothetical protein